MMSGGSGIGKKLQVFVDSALAEDWTVEQWLRWLKPVLIGRRPDPPLLIDEEPDQVMIGIFRTLKKPDLFQSAVKRLLQSCSAVEENAKQIYFLLQAISIIRPPDCLTILQQYIEEDRLVGLQCGGVDLDMIALAVRGDYGVDQEFARFIFSLNRRIKPFAYRLLCFRLLSKYDANEALRYLEELIPDLSTGATEKSVGRILRGFIKRKGCRDLFKWMKNRRLYLYKKFGSEFEKLERLFKAEIVPWRREILEDPYAALLSVYLNAGEFPFTAEEIMAIARLSYKLETLTDRREPIEVLEHLWLQTSSRATSWSKPFDTVLESPHPWVEGRFFDDHEDLYFVETTWKDEFLSNEKNRLLGQAVVISLEEERETYQVISQATTPIDRTMMIGRSVG